MYFFFKCRHGSYENEDGDDDDYNNVVVGETTKISSIFFIRHNECIICNLITNYDQKKKELCRCNFALEFAAKALMIAKA